MKYKFRAWDKENNTMLYSSEGEYPGIADDSYIQIVHDGVLFADAPDMGYYGGGDWSYKNGKYDITQWTGLTDRNGKDVYEGDFVKGAMRSDEDYKRTKQVTFLKGCFMFGNWNAHEYFNKHTHIEVIGSIYENPELINS